MANFNNIKTAIDTYIKTNGSQEITGNVLNSVLNGIIDAVESVFSIFKKDLGDKVDKVDGKGLSTNDFSNDEKEKLATLRNYDDTAFKNEVATKLSKTDAQVEFAKKQDTIADLANIRAGAAKGATALQKVPDGYATTESLNKALEKKVDKVQGKGLSTNDYTNAEKEKLSKLQNYDDTDLQEDIKQLQDKTSAFDVDSDGNIFIKGIGGYDGTNMQKEHSLQSYLAYLESNIVPSNPKGSFNASFSKSFNGGKS